MFGKPLPQNTVKPVASERRKPWRILTHDIARPSAPKTAKPRETGFSTRTLVYGFAGVIAVGTLLLMLPVSNAAGRPTSFIDALFTATSATCVTGLVVVDTGTYWSFFGQFIILLMMQIGGFGFMTGATVLFSVLGRRIGITQRLLVSESLSLEGAGGMVRMVRRMIVFTALVEGIGAVIFFFAFLGEASPLLALWRAIFQTVSSFNNAGFDIFGNFKSLVGYAQNAPVLLTTAALFILGGIGFVVVMDVYKVRRWDRLSLNSKIVLATSAALLAGATVVYLIAEYSNPATLQPMNFPVKLLNAFFQAATPRTAGFNSINTGAMLEYSLFFTIILMFIGGGSGSTAGGIKVNTFGLLLATVLSTIQGKEHAGAFGREFRTGQIYRALAVLVLSLGVAVTAVFLLTITEKSSFLNLFFVTVSALGNVGLDVGISPALSVFGRILVTLLMFIGRLGPLTLVLSLRQRQRFELVHYPEETISIG